MKRTSQRLQNRLLSCMYVPCSSMHLFTNLVSFHKAIFVIKVPVTESQCPTSGSSKFTTIGAFFDCCNFIGVLEGFFSSSPGFPPASPLRLRKVGFLDQGPGRVNQALDKVMNKLKLTSSKWKHRVDDDRIGITLLSYPYQQLLVWACFVRCAW